MPLPITARTLPRPSVQWVGPARRAGVLCNQVEVEQVTCLVARRKLADHLGQPYRQVELVLGGLAVERLRYSVAKAAVGEGRRVAARAYQHSINVLPFME